MPPIFDVKLAFARLKVDISYGRTFFRHPFELALIAKRRNQWVDELEKNLTEGTWRPTTPFVANIPKDAGGVRPGALLSLSDQVAYTAIVGAMLPNIENALNWSIPPKDYSYQLRRTGELEWISVPTWCWEQFRSRSNQLLDSGATVVVSTDITACYESIDHVSLLSDLRNEGTPAELCSLLSQCLGRWSNVDGRGLPQNITASHILAKLYLTRIDHAMADRGFTHIRYVDDIRLFCKSAADAKRSLLELAVLLRSRGLSLQSAKTERLLPAKARSKFEGMMPILKTFAKTYRTKIADQMGIDPDYITEAEAQEYVEDGKATLPPEMLREAYDTYLVKSTGRFEKSLFRYLIRRLGKARDPFALEHCMSLIEPHPEEMESVLAYIAAVAAIEVTEARILAFLRSDDAVYDYQTFQFLQWRAAQAEPASQSLLEFVRGVASAPSTARYVHSAARALLGRHGTDADGDDLMRAYGAATSDLECAEIVCSIARVEKGKRNAFLGRIKDDGFLTSAAVQGVRDMQDWYQS
jgi:hypothetical protein